MPGAYSPGVPAAEYTEEAWWRQVIELLVLFRWDFWYHTHDSRRSEAGWPDVVALRRADRRILFVELKRQTGTVTPEQISVLELLLAVSGGGWHQRRHLETHDDPHQRQPWLCDSGCARIDVELWRPGDIDRAVEVLR